MELTSEQFQQLYEALLAAYPSRGELERLIRFRLGMNLNAIVGQGSLADTVFDLVQWAVARGRAVELAEGAWEINPSNERLNAFVHTLRQQGASTAATQKGSNVQGVSNPFPSAQSNVTTPVNTSDNASTVTPPSSGPTRQVWRVVVASPGDVQAERDLLAGVVEVSTTLSRLRRAK